MVKTFTLLLYYKIKSNVEKEKKMSGISSLSVEGITNSRFSKIILKNVQGPSFTETRKYIKIEKKFTILNLLALNFKALKISNFHLFGFKISKYKFF